MVKYEQLVSNETVTINEIVDHIGAEPGGDIRNARCISDIPSVPHFQNATKAVFTSSVGRGFLELGKEELDVVNPVIEDVRAALGYERSEPVASCDIDSRLVRQQRSGALSDAAS